MTDPQEYIERRWVALILLCFAQFIVVLDASIVNVALPSIGEALNFSQANLPWVVNAYVLTFGGFLLLLGGRLADLLGRRRVFISGLLVVAAASLVAGFAATEGQLIAARAAQGLGAAIISPSALSIITNTFRDGTERNKALGGVKRSPVPVARRACCSAASSPTARAGSGCCRSTCRWRSSSPPSPRG